MPFEVQAVALDGGDCIVDGRGQASQCRVHQGLHHVVVVTLNTAKVSNRRERISNDQLNAPIGVRKLQRATAAYDGQHRR
jgi:hypothetical protein